MSDLALKLKVGPKHGLIEVLQLVEIRVNVVNKNITGIYRLNLETEQGELVNTGTTTPFLITNISEVKYEAGELIRAPEKDNKGKVIKAGIFAKGTEIKLEGSNRFDELVEALADKFEKKLEKYLKEIIKPTE